MSKNYKKPLCEVINMQPEGLIANSNQYHNNQGSGHWHAPARGWNSDDWSQEADSPDEGDE